MKVKLDKKELKKHLKEHIHFLIKSGEEYDKGYIIEAKRISASLRILLHDTKNCISLLKQINNKNMLFFDSAYDYDPNNLLSTMGLINIKIGPNKVEYIPNFDRFNYGKGKIKFDEWWNKIVTSDINRSKLSRKDLVLSVTNKDGGAHVDPNLNKEYYDISRLNSLGLTDLRKNPIKDPVLASIRQIGYEVIKSLQDEFPEYF